MKKTVAFFFFCLCLFTAHTQTTDISALWKTWKDNKQADTVRLDALHKIVIEKYLKTKPDSALHYAQTAYDFAAKKNIYSRMTQSLLLKGQACTGNKQYTEALKNLDEASALAAAHGLKPAYAKAIQYKGDVFFQQKEYDRALEQYLLSIDLWKALNDKKNLLAAMLDEGRVYNTRLQYEQIYQCTANIYTLAVELDNKPVIMGACFALGRQQLQNSDMSKSYEYYNLLLKTAQETQDSYYLPLALTSMGNFYAIQGNYPKAIDYHTQCLELLRKNKNDPSKALTDLANVYMICKETDKALELFNEALVTSKENNNIKNMASVYNSLSSIYADQGKFADAVSAARQSIACSKEFKMFTNELYAMNTLGKAFALAGQYDSTLLWAGKAREMASTMGIPLQEKYADLTMAIAHYGLHHNEEAKKYILDIIHRNEQILKRNFPFFSEKEQELLFNTLSPQYISFYTLAYGISASDPTITENVYNTIARNKGMLLRSSTAMRQSVLSSNDTALIRQYNEWTALNKQISRLMSTGKDTKTLEEKANLLEKELVRKSEAIKDFGKTSDITWKTVQAGLKPKEAAIEFIKGEMPGTSSKELTYYALVVKPGMLYPQMIALCTENQLLQVLKKSGGNNLDYISHVYGTQKTVSDTLYQLLWKPLEKTLKGVKTVYLSPDGLLHKISFAAIAKDRNTLLCDAYDIRLQGSTANITAAQNHDFAANMGTTVFGGIDYDSEQTDTEIWNYLEGTKTEADNIVTLLKKQQVPVSYFSGKQASELSFKNTAGKNAVLHIATHGFFYPDPETITENISVKNSKKTDVVFRGDADMNIRGVQSFVLNKNPLMRSGLAFAGANDVWKTSAGTTDSEDGVLTAQEVTQMDLRKTRLVVLSACETGLGDIKGSEGVYGLQRSFKMAGVQFLIMSLWQVPDKETGEFMLLFYEKLVKTKDTRAAFSSAQKVMREKYDPYYWAAFVLVE